MVLFDRGTYLAFNHVKETSSRELEVELKTTCGLLLPINHAIMQPTKENDWLH